LSVESFSDSWAPLLERLGDALCASAHPVLGSLTNTEDEIIGFPDAAARRQLIVGWRTWFSQRYVAAFGREWLTKLPDRTAPLPDGGIRHLLDAPPVAFVENAAGLYGSVMDYLDRIGVDPAWPRLRSRRRSRSSETGDRQLTEFRRVLSRNGGQPLDTLLRQKVLDPMGLDNTVGTQTSEIPSPVLHAFDSERRTPLGIAPTASFYEESSFWNAQWGTPIGANETTTIDDMVTTAAKVGSGALLSPSSYEAMTGPNLLGFGHKQDNCASCITQAPAYNYGLGIVRSGSWLLQGPLLSGYGATEAYLPSQQVAIAVAVTFAQGAFDSQGGYTNASDTLFRSIGTYLVPNDAPPPPLR
jgi:hypothetical protein